METLKEKTAKGLFWGAMNNGVQQLLGLAFGIILGRLLDPSDYGMTAMLAVFSVIANELQSSGFKTGLINLKAPQHEDYNAVFWFNILVGGAIYVVFFFAAPLIADFYGNQALIPLSRYVFLGFVFSSFGIAQSAYLTKQLQIKQIAKCGMTATLSSSIMGVILAALGFGYWALATQYLMYIAVNTLLLWYFSPWRPSFWWRDKGGGLKENTPTADVPPTVIPPSTLHLPPSTIFAPLKKIFPFSVRIMFSAIFTQVNANIMNLLLGRFYGSANTGHYNQAYQWSSKCFLLVGNMLRQVDQTVLVGLTDERERQLAVLRKMVRFTAFISFPLLFCLGLVSHEFIVLAIGEKWTFAASLLPYLCLCGAFMPLSTLLTDSVISQHRSDIYLWNTIALGVLQIALMVGLWRQGIYVMVIAYTLLNIVWVFVWHFFVRRLMGYGLLQFLKDIVPFALTAAGVMVVTYFLTEFTVYSLRFTGDYLKLWVLLISRVVLAIILYYAVMRIAGAVILKECLAFIKKSSTKKSPTV
jgi:O-antigen/teichoic acid export membrane protein